MREVTGGGAGEGFPSQDLARFFDALAGPRERADLAPVSCEDMPDRYTFVAVPRVRGARMGRPHPGVALAVCGCAALVGVGGRPHAIAALLVLGACVALWRVRVGPLLRRVLVAAAALSGFFAFAPWVGWQAVDLVVRGLAVTSACLVLGASASWSSWLAMLERAGLPRALVAYLAILARHAGTVRDEVVRMHRAVALRGGYRTWPNRLRSWRLLMVRLLPEVIRRADRTADVLALRGFCGRLPGRPAGPLTAVDAATVGLGLALVATGVLL